MNFRKKLQAPQAGFQMAPMIDIMFLLLIFFMAAAVYAQWEKKIGIEVPTTRSYESQPRVEGEIIVNLEADGRIFIGNVEMDRSRLESLLRNVVSEYRDHPIIIRADAATSHRDVMGVLDVCRVAGVWNVAFAVLPEPDSE